MFQGFNPKAERHVYFTTMPHWRQDGCTYFVTYRLADSIPKSVLDRWEENKRIWLKQHGASLPPEEPWHDAFLRLPRKLQFEFQQCFNRELNAYLDEGRGSCVLREPRCSQIIVDGWDHFHGQRYEIRSLVVMPNHVHLLVCPLPGFELEKILQSRKRQSAREINNLLGKEGKLWQKHSFDHIVRNEEALAKFTNYIAENPAMAGLKSGFRRFDW